MDKDGLDQSLNKLVRIPGRPVAGPEDEDDDDVDDDLGKSTRTSTFCQCLESITRLQIPLSVAYLTL